MSELALNTPMDRPASEAATHAAAPSSPAAGQPAKPASRPSRWPRLLLALVLIGAATLAALAWIAQDLSGWSAPVHLQIDGEQIFSGFHGHDLPPAHRVVLAMVLLMAGLALLVIVPLAVTLVLMAVAGAVLLAIGLPLLLVLGSLALLLSPLLLLAWLVWKLLS